MFCFEPSLGLPLKGRWCSSGFLQGPTTVPPAAGGGRPAGSLQEPPAERRHSRVGVPATQGLLQASQAPSRKFV